jgi:hypothetical protein
MFLKLFLILLCPLSLNGLQHIALVIQEAIIVLNTLNQQNIQHKINISYAECSKNTELLSFQVRQPQPHETCSDLPILQDLYPSAKSLNDVSHTCVDLSNMYS